MTLQSWPPADRHSLWEDMLGVTTGCLLMALSVQFLRESSLITGQIAGLSLIGAYLGGWSFGTVFFVLNLPFYGLALLRMGWRFTLRTFAAVGLMAFLADTLPSVLTLTPLHPAVGALGFGVLAGLGLIVLFRHGATLGGVGIVALWAQDRHGIPAGAVQLGFDVCVFALALTLFALPVVGWSFLGAAVLNVMILVNHRRDRYIARS